MQLPLPVSLPVHETFDSFVEGVNGEAVNMLKRITQSLSHASNGNEHLDLQSLSMPMVLLRGGAATGKSHLLFSVCHRLARAEIAHLYLNFDDASQWVPSVLEGLESLPVICLDNIDSVAGDPLWEEALFDLFNKVIEKSNTLVICTQRMTDMPVDFVLPDLASRLSWGVTYHLKSLNDEGREKALRLRATQKGLSLSEQALQFLLHHSDRTITSLVSLLDRLDSRSLQEQKKLSVAMVKRELNLP